MGKVRDGFQTDLKSVLTEDQIAKLDALQADRMQQMMNRGGGRGGWRRQRPLSRNLGTGGDMDSSILPLFSVSRTKGDSRCKKNGSLL